MMDCATKTCCRCGVVYTSPADHFNRQRSTRDGFTPQCKTCRAAMWQEQYERHHEKLIASACERVKRLRETSPEYRELDRRYSRDAQRRRLQDPANREGHRASRRRWYEATIAVDPDLNRRQHAIRNDHRVANGGSGLGREDTARMLVQQNGRCHWCGAGLRAGGVHHDHVIPLSRGGRDDPSNVVLSCAACNLSKGPRTPEEFAAYRQEMAALAQ